MIITFLKFKQILRQFINIIIVIYEIKNTVNNTPDTIYLMKIY